MKKFYEALIAAFENTENKERYTEAELRPIKHVDIYAGQDFNPEYFDAHLFPAVFVIWEINHDNGLSTAQITIRLAYEQLRDTSSNSSNRDKALQSFELVAITNDIIQDVQTDYTGKLRLNNESLDINDTVVDVVVLQYSCAYNERGRFGRKSYVKGAINTLEMTDEQIKERLG